MTGLRSYRFAFLLFQPFGRICTGFQNGTLFKESFLVLKNSASFHCNSAIIVTDDQQKVSTTPMIAAETPSAESWEMYHILP